MNLTANRLTAAAGLSAAAAGAIFVGVQIGHPPTDVAHIVTTELLIRQSAKVLFTVLALVGITGMFVRHHRRFGALGLAGFVLLSVGFLAMFAVEVIGAYVLPTVAQTNPAYVQDVLDAAVGASPSGDIGHMQRGVPRRRHRLLARRSAVRHRAVPRRHPGPLGLAAPRLRDHLRPRAGRAARSPSTARSPCPPASR